MIDCVEVGVSKHYLFASSIEKHCVWLTLVVLYTLVAPDHSSKHGVSVIIFLFHPTAFQPLSLQILVPFYMMCWKCSFQTSLLNSLGCLWSLSTFMSSYEAINVGFWSSTRTWQGMTQLQFITTLQIFILTLLFYPSHHFVCVHDLRNCASTWRKIAPLLGSVAKLESIMPSMRL